MMRDKLTKASVNYRPALKGARRMCGNCSMYTANACSLVRGVIKPADVCDRWEAKK